jgi:formate hydrogenlyase transcriptional activator
VADGYFRSDLFYRLHIFPLHMPALRERSSDIPLLVRHFAEKFSLLMNKKIETIPDELMDAMMRRAWPGNVRELEHFVERCVILSNGPVLRAPVEEFEAHSDPCAGLADALISVRREHIVKVLRETGGVISGPKGAAARLGLKRTTLQSMMQRLGITRRDYES